MRFVKPYSWEIVLTIVIGIVKFAIPLFIPLLIKIVLDDIIAADDLTDGEKTKELLYWLGGTIIVFFIIRPPIEYYRQYFAQHVSNKVLFDIRKEIYAHLQRLSLKYYANTRAGDVISRVINDVEQTKNFVMTGLMNVWLDLATIVIAVIIMLTMDIKLTLVALLAFPFYALSVKYFFGKLRDLTRKRSQALAGVQSYLHERVAGMSIIKSFTLEKHEQKLFDEANGEFLEKALDQTKWNAKSFAVVNTITDVAPLLVIAYAGYEVINGTLSVGTMVAFIAYIERLYGPLRRLVSSSTTLTQSIASMDRMFDLMDEPYEVKNKVDARDLRSATGEVRFDHVSFQYEKEGVPILNNINFTINPGETVAFVGMSGGGKSTIISLIPRFYDATDGVVTIDGQDVRDVTLHSLRSQIGIVLQDNILFSDSVKENILMGKPDATDEQVIEAAKAANAHDFIMTLPNGYDTKVGERGVKLSGGQKQRVAIARVFLKNPPILILDEATSALDLESEALIQESLEELAHERTTIIIAHRLSTITHADKIFVIDHGQLIESGNHEQLMTKQGTYYDLFQVQHLE
ncbi:MULTISPECIES: ABC transporter ATP-binding protein [Lysinibacillus]|jgi:subfamily B ATP-binding cassette protein MsbA|uniref:ABC transporter ATP-binding protein n=1 Tax=Lysinibacillus TaxID=400634 RepID=UPI000A5B3741|nr:MULTISPECIES: ABC transporter ATP-binding protein [Lysinibacillus]MCT6815103.1 ABC transporter ATP-binding protein/permease [Lysinibacillus fusiformis]MCT6930199.1 ABC transporter ATP-binding protein/permease [Lysinibacillus fusiformis]MCT6934447.1 ABC transporter ATP-binding protein/permease [Lysinibacillus fusiformis]MDC6270040.1 ABC transporter ATP-binding protein [Lysinibacillus sphaericus]MDN4971370.1 ABC transporter ATP-binding protein [Lysinibacillus fusiformis]